ncbi:hypothetical protein [Dietzia aurantiaca]|uniref:Uncharacterized protein n=1 Tax=Dietzia aurantiaca TaxID=983873 RepID=A0ABV9PQM2_9ACTN
MAEDSDGQQITVAELLKRMGAEQQEVAPTGRRRRRADEGGVSVSELTGEIPRITDDTVLSGRAARRHAREVEASEGGSSPSADEPRATGDPTGAGAGTAQPGATGRTTTPPPTPQPSTPKSGQAPASASQARPSATQQPPTAQPPAAAQTARIPAQQPGARQQAPAQQPPAPGTGARATADEAPEGQPQEKRRGLFGRKRKEKDSAAAAAARPSGAWTPDAREDRGPSGAGVAGAAGAGGAAAGGAGLAGAAATDSGAGSQAGPGQPAAAQTQPQTEAPTQPQAKDSTAGDTAGRADSAPARQQAWGVPTGSGSTAHSAPEAPAGAVAGGTATTDKAADKAGDKNTDAAPVATASAPGVRDAGAATGSGATAGTDTNGREGSFGRAAAAAAGGAGVAGMTAAAVSGDRDSAPATTDRYRDSDPDAARADHSDTERSPASQWMILVAQVLASAVAGAALFIGFQLLWTDLPWVAFALAIIVIVGLVAMVRVLRRSNDTVSIALAVIVGIGVTCGPLLLRLVT